MVCGSRSKQMSLKSWSEYRKICCRVPKGPAHTKPTSGFSFRETTSIRSGFEPYTKRDETREREREREPQRERALEGGRCAARRWRDSAGNMYLFMRGWFGGEDGQFCCRAEALAGKAPWCWLWCDSARPILGRVRGRGHERPHPSFSETSPRETASGQKLRRPLRAGFTRRR